jgi:uncharacterized protein
VRRRPIDYFRMFDADTALFGERHVLFASDAPFEPEPGLYIRETIEVIRRLPVSDETRARIYSGNALALLKRITPP